MKCSPSTWPPTRYVDVRARRCDLPAIGAPQLEVLVRGRTRHQRRVDRHTLQDRVAGHDCSRRCRLHHTERRAPNEPVEAGHVFTLNDEPRDEWLADASTVGLVDFALPPTVTIRTAWQQRRLAITLQHDRLVSGLLVTADPAIGGDVRSWARPTG
ncbi:MAG: hypothetical protein R3C10_27665 [Pirellulales bacterium]